jgi:hypothetical protein
LCLAFKLVVLTRKSPSPLLTSNSDMNLGSSCRAALAFAFISTASADLAFANGDTALYDVRFDATWSNATHPGAFPGGAHFSPLIGATHNSSVEFWAPGSLATPGIEGMAETGSQFGLFGEINVAITAGTAGAAHLGNGLGSPDTESLTFTVTDEFPLFTMVTMIAPSPDWFVGVHGVDLQTSTGWVDSLTVQAFAYDSGTDNGLGFNSPNSNTSPADPISLITGGPFDGTVDLGTFTFTRRASTFSYGSVNPVDSFLQTGGDTQIGGTGQINLALSDPTGSMGQPSIAFWAASASADPLFPNGSLFADFGLIAPGSVGELLVGPTFITRVAGVWNGSPVNFNLPIPNDPALDGAHVYFQGFLIDGSNRIGLTNAIEFVLGL